MNTKKIPLLGMRTIKTMIAVYFCFMIGMLRGVLPFYSAISAVLCIKKDINEGKRAGVHRMLGTLVGGGIGLVSLLIFREIPIPNFGWLHFLLITFALVPVIYFMVALNAKAAVFIACVVFLSVTVSHGGDEQPYIFAANRMMDTFIGIIIAWIVNRFLPMEQSER